MVNEGKGERIMSKYKYTYWKNPARILMFICSGITGISLVEWIESPSVNWAFGILSVMAIISAGICGYTLYKMGEYTDD